MNALPPLQPPADTLDVKSFPVSSTIIPGVALLLDITILFANGLILYFIFVPSEHNLITNYIAASIFVAMLYALIGKLVRLFNINSIMKPLKSSDDIIVNVLSSYFFLLSFVTSIDSLYIYDRLWIVLYPVSAIVTLVGSRTILWLCLRWLARHGMIGRCFAVLSGGEQGKRFLNRLRTADPHFFKVTRIYDIEAVDRGEHGIDALLKDIRALKVDNVVIAMPWNAEKVVGEAVARLRETPVNVYLSTDLVGFELAFRPVAGDLASLPMFEVIERPISGWNSALKTIEDYSIALVLLLALLPLLLLVAAAIKLDTPGPVFFMQRRLGFNNKEFRIYKFRSMHHKPIEDTVVRQTTRGDPRVTRVGRIIRATSIDELPQLLNVLDGTMSLVGPRPHAISHNEEYGRQIRGYFARHRVKPGITGWAQVNGLRGETETIEKMEARIRHDVYYADNWSLLFDMRILIQTGLVFLFQRGAF